MLILVSVVGGVLLLMFVYRKRRPMQFNRAMSAASTALLFLVTATTFAVLAYPVLQMKAALVAIAALLLALIMSKTLQKKADVQRPSNFIVGTPWMRLKIAVYRGIIAALIVGVIVVLLGLSFNLMNFYESQN